MIKVGSGILLLLLSFNFSLAQTQIPNCLNSQSQAMPIDDGQVLKYKVSTPNQYLTRAHIKGIVSHLFADHSGHNHFEVKIGSGPNDTIEVVYNQSFGALPALSLGMTVEACGDYITANRPTSNYPPSPDGAILHWVHKTTGGHLGGFVAINNVLYGEGSGNGGN